MITIENYKPDEQKRYEMGQDIAEEVDQMMRLEEEDLPEFKPLFDPIQF